MNFKWSKWKPFDAPFRDIPTQPYLHWLAQTGNDVFSFDPSLASSDEKLVPQIARTKLEAKQSILFSEGSGPIRKEFDRHIPIPKFALNPDFAQYIDRNKNWLPEMDELPDDIDDNTIIVGVIDVGIPLGHNRFRAKDGSSRILSAWQHLGEWGGDDGLKQPFLPFGRELYKKDIDALLAKHSNGDLNGDLDEESFNVATGVLDKKHLFGSRDAAKRFSHGAHVLDAAAGCDPEIDDDFQKRVKIIAVNIPNSETFGASGQHLDEFMVYAIQRISDVADAIWKRNHPEWNPNNNSKKPIGYPLVINISFGKQAGSKNILDPFPATLKKFRDCRLGQCLFPVNIVMPAGNDNQLRCNAFLEPDSNKSLSLDWRILPEDQSSNYVEIWSTFTVNEEELEILGSGHFPIEIALIPPGFDEDDQGFNTSPGVINSFQSLECDQVSACANVYFEIVPIPGKKNIARLKYTLCVAPTLRRSGKGPTAPSGIWKIKIHNNWHEQLQCVLSVQTDQAILPERSVNLRSYFDDPNYRLYDEDGIEVESYSYDRMATTKPVNLDLKSNTNKPSPVKRHGTMNASASHKHVARVGGYRVSDGKPAPYSATGRGRAPVLDANTDMVDPKDDGTTVVPKYRDDDHSRAPTACLPTDDGPAHFGILAAGAANGSVIAAQGTSFASAQATRCVAETLLTDSNPNWSPQKRLFELASEHRVYETENQQDPLSTNSLDIDNAGHWRIPNPLTSKVSRTG